MEVYSHQFTTVQSACLNHVNGGAEHNPGATTELSVLLVTGFLNSPLVGVIDGQVIRIGCC